jgi:hypothetical protein
VTASTDRAEGTTGRPCRGHCPTVYLPLATDDLVSATVLDVIPPGCIGACLVIERWDD